MSTNVCDSGVVHSRFVATTREICEKISGAFVLVRISRDQETNHTDSGQVAAGQSTAKKLRFQRELLFMCAAPHSFITLPIFLPGTAGTFMNERECQI